MFDFMRKMMLSGSTRRFLQEASRVPNYTWRDRIHGYVYARWPYTYIATGLGKTRLAHAGAALNRLWRAIVPGEPMAADRGPGFAATYHGKVVPPGTAKRLITIDRPLNLILPESIIPFQEARQLLIEPNQSLAVLECPCRSARENPCHPIDVCMIVGEPFVTFILEHHPSRSRRLNMQEAVEILAEEHERGHVHHAFFKDAMLGRFYAICNCCACCCGAMQAHRHGTPMLISSGYVSSVDRDICVGCGVCREYCQFQALSMDVDYTMQVDGDTCMGCGVCVDQCDMEAMTLIPHPERGIPLELEQLLSEAVHAMESRAPVM